MVDDYSSSDDPQAAAAAAGWKKYLGDTRTADSVEPTGSPIDLIAGGLGAKLGEGAADIVGNETGMVGTDLDQALRQQNAQKMGFDTSKTYYHGTKADISEFDPNALGTSTGAPSARQAYFFASDPSTASDYAEVSAGRPNLRGAVSEGPISDELDSVHAELVDKYGPKFKTPENYDAELEYEKGRPGGMGLTDQDFKEAGITRVPESEPLLDKWKDVNSRYSQAFEQKNITPKNLQNDILDLQRERAVQVQNTDVLNAMIKSHQNSIATWQDALDNYGPEVKRQYGLSRDQIQSKMDKLKDNVSKYQNAVSPEGLQQQTSKIADIDSQIKQKQKLLMDSTSGQNVLPVHLKVQNPYIHDFQGESYRDQSYNDIIKKAKAAGHDSVIFKNTYDPGNPNNRVMQDITAVFDPAQIRSKYAGFDPSKANSSNLSYAKGGQVKKYADGGNVADTISTGQAAPQAVTDNTTNVVGPDGELTSVTNDQLQNALHPVNGYRLATPEDVKAYQSKQKYGGIGQQALTAAEQAASTATFGASSGVERALGVKPEDITGREAENPASGLAGSVLPFAAEQLIPGAGQAADVSMAGKLARLATAAPRAITEAGEAVSAGSGLTGVGAKAVQYAAENAIMQGGNEVSKALLGDPDATAANVIANEGLASLFGGALGVAAGGIGKVPEMWKSKFGAKTIDQAVDQGANHLGAQEVMAGMNVPEVLRDALSGDNDAYNRVQTLNKSDSFGGRQIQAATSDLYNQAQDQTLNALGVKPEAFEKAPNDYEVGTKIQQAVKDAVQQESQTYAPAYKALESQYKAVPVNPEQRAAFAGKLTQAVSDAGLEALAGSSEGSAVRKVFDSLDTINNANGIKQLNTAVNNLGKNPELQRVAAVVSPLLKDFESTVVQSHLGQLDPTGTLLATRKTADDAFKSAMNKMNDLKSQLGLSRFKGTNGFVRALDDKTPEQILKRATAKNSQDFTQLLEKNYPEVAKIVRDYHVNSQLNDAKIANGKLDTKKFLNGLLDQDKNPPHILRSIAGQSAPKLEAIKNIINAIPKDGNPSNSARMIDALWKTKLGSLAGGALGFATHGLGGSVLGNVLGSASDLVTREVSPFLSYKVLEMRGGGKSLLPDNVKALFDYAHSAGKGHLAVMKAVDNLIGGKHALSPSQIPSDADIKKLDKHVSEVNKTPSVLQDTASDLTAHMPDHVASLSLTATTAANYLNSIKPRPPIGAPLDSKAPVNSADKAQYNRQLKIAQQPLMILKHIQEGTLTPQDIKTVGTIYPKAYGNMQQRILSEAVQANQKGTVIPYKQRLMMSMFVGQPLDSTMTPQSIISAQPQPTPGPQQQQQQGANKPKRGTASLSKMSNQFQTKNQAAEADQTKRE